MLLPVKRHIPRTSPTVSRLPVVHPCPRINPDRKSIPRGEITVMRHGKACLAVPYPRQRALRRRGRGKAEGTSDLGRSGHRSQGDNDKKPCFPGPALQATSPSGEGNGDQRKRHDGCAHLKIVTHTNRPERHEQEANASDQGRCMIGHPILIAQHGPNKGRHLQQQQQEVSGRVYREQSAPDRRSASG